MISRWTYDSLGNILSSAAGSYAYGGTASGSYANPHAVTGIGSAAYAYDENGNMTSDGTWTNGWDYRSRLVASDDGVTTVSYAYDHEGNRVAKTDSAGTTAYPNGYYSVEGSEVKRHISLGSFGALATSSYDTTVLAAETAYHHKDHLGGTHVDTDSSGSALEYSLYEPFGASVADWKSGAYENDRKFTGKELDGDTGWHYYGSRYYASGEGRFLSEDPVFLTLGTPSDKPDRLRDPQAWNAYAYVRNNPLRLVDPDGEDFVDKLNTANAVVDFLGNALTFGVYGSALDNAGQAGKDLAQAGLSPLAVVSAVASVESAAGATVIGAGANVVGGPSATAGKVGANVVYHSVDDAGRAIYVGITNNLERRAAEHAATKGITIKAISGLTNLSREIARGAEQAMIEAHGMIKNGGTLLNKINSIGTKNPAYQNLLEQGKHLIDQIKK